MPYRKHAIWSRLLNQAKLTQPVYEPETYRSSARAPPEVVKTVQLTVAELERVRFREPSLGHSTQPRVRQRASELVPHTGSQVTATKRNAFPSYVLCPPVYNRLQKIEEVLKSSESYSQTHLILLEEAWTDLKKYRGNVFH